MTLATAMLPTAGPAQLAADSGGGSGFTGILLLLGLVVFAYFILIRPQRNRMKQLQMTQASLTPGAEVMTTAGLYATVVDFDNETVTLETAPGVHNRYVRAAVAKIITPGDAPVDELDDELDEEPEDSAPGDAADDAAGDDGGKRL